MNSTNGLEELFDRKLAPLFTKINVLSTKVDEAIHSLEFLSEKYDELNLKVNKLENENKELNQQNEYLRRELTSTKAEFKIVQDVQDDLEQYTRRDCLELRGIPERIGENTNEIVMKIASTIGVVVEESDISISHRLGIKQNFHSQRSFKAIIVKFTRRTKREEMYAAKSKLKDVGINDLGYTRFGNSKIFMVESLTSKRKELFKHCVQAKKSEVYRYLWTRQGKIYMRKNDDSPAIHITSTSVLDRILNK